MKFAIWSICAVFGGYQLFAWAAAIRYLARRRSRPAQTGETLPVSILKPVRGREPWLEECLRSHATQDYPEYELLFGLADPADPARPAIEELIRKFPHRSIRLVLTTTTAPNRKVGVLEDLAREARHPILVVNDADVRVPPGYLREVTAVLAGPRAGVVTCLYRTNSPTFPGRWEALGIATDFIPSVLVAPLAGVTEFALGSTLAFRAADLARAGGFTALRDYLADDYQLGRMISELGLRVEVAATVVDTSVGGTWREVWDHQVRWARTIRVSRPGGYAGLILTNASVAAAAVLVAGFPWHALGLLSVRYVAALTVALGVLGSRLAATHWPLIPLRDLWGAAVWFWGFFGREVLWRGRRLRLNPEGRIVEARPA